MYIYIERERPQVTSHPSNPEGLEGKPLSRLCCAAFCLGSGWAQALIRAAYEGMDSYVSSIMLARVHANL